MMTSNILTARNGPAAAESDKGRTRRINDSGKILINSAGRDHMATRPLPFISAARNGRARKVLRIDVRHLGNMVRNER